MSKYILLLLSFVVLMSGCGPSGKEREMEADVRQLRADLKQKQIELTHLQEELGQNKIVLSRFQKNIDQKKDLLDFFGDTLETVDEEREKYKLLQANYQVAQAHLIRNTRMLAQLQAQLAQAMQAQANLADYKVLGTPTELRKMMKRAHQIDAKKKNTKALKSGVMEWTITSFDLGYNFYVINGGANHGIKTGDEYNVLRAGKVVGRIKIQRTQPTISIVGAIKKFTRQQLLVGDKITKGN